LPIEVSLSPSSREVANREDLDTSREVIKHPEKPDSIFLDALLKNGDGEWRA
jgi:hypothetical protein